LILARLEQDAQLTVSSMSPFLFDKLTWVLDANVQTLSYVHLGCKPIEKTEETMIKDESIYD
jgi:hypothetical protein